MSKDIANQLYLSYLGRPSDVGWRTSTAGVLNGAAPSVALQRAFFTAAVLEGVYSLSDSPASLVNKIFQNIFGFGASTFEQTAWGDLITKGVITYETAAWTIFSSYLGAPNTASYVQLTQAKLVAIDAYTTALESNAAANLAVSQIGGAGASAARSVITGVTSVATAAAVVAGITTTVATAAEAATGSAYTLTTGVDTFTGTSGNDLFNAPTGAFTSLDRLDGGSGTDTLNWTETAAVTTSPASATLTSIEKIKFNSNDAYTIDLTGTTFSGSGLTSFAGTNAGAKAVNLTGAATTDLSVTNATLGGSTADADAATVTVNGGKAITVSIGQEVASDRAGGAIKIGETTAAAGAVTVTNAFTSAGVTTGKTATASEITVKGGTVITVNQTITPTSAAAATVLADSRTVKNAGGAVTVTGTASTTDVTVTQSAAVTEVANSGLGRIGIVNGKVTINDANAASTTAAGTIKTVTITNAGDAVVNSGALTTLNLGGTLKAVNAGTLGALTTPANTSLALNLTGAVVAVDSAVTIDTDITTLNVTGSTTASTVDSLVANGAKAINVAGDAKVTFTKNTIGAATDITVTNTGGASFGTALGTAVNFTGGAGADSVSLGATTKAIVMGAGNDSVTSGGTVGTGGSVAAGDGTDTIVMTAADAVTASGSSTFNSKFTGFEVLRVSDQLAGNIDLDGINGATSVILVDGSDGTNRTIANLASGGTVQTNATATDLTVGVKSALVGSSDVLNLVLSKTGGALTGGKVTAANVETINISAPDAASAGSAANTNTLTLVATSATTVTVSGNNGLTLTNAGNTAITKFDASGVVANDTAASTFVAATTDSAANLAVTFTSANTTATASVSITGGAGNDTLTGSVAKDAISGGAGADTIYGDNAGTKEVDTLALTFVSAATATITIAGIATTYNAVTDAATSATAARTAINANAALKGIATASGATDKVIITYLVDGDQTAPTGTGGATGANTETTAGTAGTVAVDSLDGGAGADFLVGGGGADTIATGAGADTVFFLKAHSTLAATATITDYTFVTGGTSNDKIILGDQVAATGNVKTVQDLSSSATIAAAADAAALANTTDNGLYVFTWGGAEYVYVETTGSNTSYAATDFIVRLTGVPLAVGATIAGAGFDAV